MSRLRPLVDSIVDALKESPGQTAREIAHQVGEPKSTVNSVLYSRTDLFFRSSDTRPRWWLQPIVSSSREHAQSVDFAPLELDLFQWQEEALEVWAGQSHRGVIEAVTGSGKTRVGLAAAQRQLEAGGKVAVIVPTCVLLRQWSARIKEWLPDASVGLMGDGHADDLSSADILIAVVNSAATHALGLPPGCPGLLIADECHRYAGDRFSLALEEEFDHRLGLTATYDRDDGGHETILDPYFGGIVFAYGYADAVGQGVVAPFRVALLPVRFSPGEREEYEEFTELMRKARKTLIGLGAPDEPYQAFIEHVHYLSNHGARHEGIVAGRYLKAMRARRDLLALAGEKYDALASLADALGAASRSIVFTETIPSASRCAALLTQHGAVAEALHSEMPAAERVSVLGRFADGSMQAIVAPRLLDEGVDVPEADLGVIFAASRQRRQMVQRLGRVLRRKQDGRAARFAILFVEGTAEDPGLSAHETFLDEILDVADDIQRFPAGAFGSEVTAFLAP